MAPTRSQRSAHKSHNNKTIKKLTLNKNIESHSIDMVFRRRRYVYKQ